MTRIRGGARAWIGALFAGVGCVSVLAQEPATGAIDPAVVRNALARLSWQQLGQGYGLDQVERSFRAVLAGDPSHVGARTGLAAVLLRHKRPRAAVKVLKTGVARRPDSAALHAFLGRAYIELGRGQKAVEHLHRAEDLAPEYPDLDYWLGVAHLQAGQNWEALDRIRAAEPRTLTMLENLGLYECVALARVGATGPAIEGFTEIHRQAAGTPLGDLAGRLKMATQPGVRPARRLRGSVRAGLRYDDNALVLPTTAMAGIQEADSASFGGLLQARVAYDVVQDNRAGLTAGYSYLQTTNFSEHEADLLDNAVFLAGALRSELRGVPTQFGLRVDGNYLTVDFESFLQGLAVTPTASFQVRPGAVTTVFGRYLRHDYKRQGRLDGTPRDRDAYNWVAGMVQTLRLPWYDAQVQGGYRYTWSAADGADFDYGAHQLLGGVRVPLPVEDLALTVGGEVHFRDYENRDSVANECREDTQYVAYGALQYDIDAHWAVALEFRYDRNDSSLALNDFERNVVSVTGEWRF